MVFIIQFHFAHIFCPFISDGVIANAIQFDSPQYGLMCSYEHFSGIAYNGPIISALPLPR
ncbi:MAG TPA: hypothetical protein DG942_06520 [Ruminococcaceae bacterium]|nr:hypothetical protein [Oscillospiraceae bacterium]